ncbi:hypothetical protein BG000_009962 [Podila horticola]|nr:hypothetical protein BG000_009962 [Podila horticola]
MALEDTSWILIDAGFGADNRKAVDAKILSQGMTLLKATPETEKSDKATDLLWKAVSLTYAEGMELLHPVQIDPGFLKFYDYTLKHQIPFTALSCGLDFIIQEYLARHLGVKAKITILAYYDKVVEDKWAGDLQR